ncbi:hypothetical protein OQA88_2897 [Cercophora sp. LCS_1]
MYAPIHAPEAHHHLGPRQVWDTFTSALGNVFGVDDDEDDSKTSTSTIVKTVVTTAGTPTPTPAQTTAVIVTASPKTITTTVRATPTFEPEPTTVPALPLETAEKEILPSQVIVPSDATTISETTLALAPPLTTSSSSATPTGKAFGDQTTGTGVRPSPTAQPEESNDTSSAAKAGIVIGVLAGILAIFVLAWLLYNRRRKQLEQRKMEAEDEKINGPINPFADSAAIRTPATAPRLSLRPVTQFLPNLTTTLPDRRTSRGAGMMLASHAEEPQEAQSPLQRPAGASAWERHTVSSANNSPTNPFGDAQRIPEESSAQVRPVSPPSPLQGQAALATSGSPPRPVSPLDGSEGAAAGVAGAAAGAAAGSGLIRKASIRKDLPRPLDLTMPPPMSAVPPSPAGTEFSVNSVAPGQPLGPSASAAAIAAAGGPPQSTVHRVTMDFKPTLEDEMGLNAGQLVRLLHEYDDGWALCIRLDRSQQGVVPRTCLSTRPVKPRSPPGGHRGGPPINPNRAYGGPPVSMRGPPHNGNGGRPMSPYGRPHSPGGRMSPPNGRSQSPGPRYQQAHGRPMSPNTGRRTSPPGQQMHMQQQQQQQMRGAAPGQAY